MDLNQVKSLFTATDFERGMEYYRKGRVTDIQCTKAGTETNVSCTVRGSERYTVRFTEMAEGRLRISCTCPRYADVGRCKHLAAAMIAYIGEPPRESVPGSDSCARWMLQRYLQITQESIEPSQQPIRLTAVLRAGYRTEYPSFSLRVGFDRLYSVQNIREFLDNVSQRRTVVYGKGLTLEHNLELFEPIAQAMIRLLMNEYGRYRALGSSSYYMGYEPPDYRKNEITLTGDSFDRWFDLLSDAPVDCAGSGPLTLTQADPQVRLQIAEEGGGAWLTVQTPCPYRFFGSYRSLYALGGGKLLRCSGEFREKIYPLLEATQQTMYLARKDLPTFCGCVLPALDGQVEIEDPQKLLQNYIPDPCTVCFYFDMEQDTLLVKPVFRYDTHSIAFDDSSEPDGVRRNKKEESAALLFVRRYFQ